MITTNDPIDAVVTWVDGTNPDHRSMRARYLAMETGHLGENAKNPHRWEQSNEIYYCLNSIHRFAPWVRRIWVVVDGVGPDMSLLPNALRDKISIASHEEIFAGYADVLPTFNSLSIESMLWRIAGLAEQFLYFNDDVFLTAPLVPEDLFNGGDPVLRGAWRDYSGLMGKSTQRDDPAQFNRIVQMNAAAICGVGAGNVFSAAHVVHPTCRSVMADLFQRHGSTFEQNIRHRFRDLEQFSPQSLHNHSCITQSRVSWCQDADYLHITSGQGANAPPDQTRNLLLPQALAGIKFLCVNDLPQLEALVPDARDLIGAAVGMDIL